MDNCEHMTFHKCTAVMNDFTITKPYSVLSHPICITVSSIYTPLFSLQIHQPVCF